MPPLIGHAVKHEDHCRFIDKKLNTIFPHVVFLYLKIDWPANCYYKFLSAVRRQIHREWKSYHAVNYVC